MKFSKRDLRRVFGFGMLAAGLLVFQNCSKVAFSVNNDDTVHFMATSSLTINDGATYTRDIGVNLKIEAPLAAEMYVTNDPACQSGGVWEPLTQTRAWKLGQENAKAMVFARFRSAANGTDLPCISASIVHDNIAPKIEFSKRPGSFLQALAAHYEFDGQDNLSGLDHFECQAGFLGKWTTCESPMSPSFSGEGSHEFLIRAIDKAGNMSVPLPDSFLIDMTPPTVVLTQTPAALSNQATAVFRFDANDEGSGVASSACQLTSAGQAGPVIQNCTAPAVFNDLGSDQAPVSYRFSVWAIDNAGNQSTTTTYDFTVNRQPSGAFSILGVTGGSDTSIDNLLGTSATPTVHWTQSSGAAKYYVAILDDTGAQTVCADAAVPTGTLLYSFPATSCVLKDATKYQARVIAEDPLGNRRQADLFEFTVDLTPPSITITGPTLTNNDKDAAFQFTITDTSGIQSATCYRDTLDANSSVTQTVPTSCTTLTDLKYPGLATGTYAFHISATDKAGNQGSSQTITWSVKQVICDPFTTTGDGTCQKGLQANLFYLSDAQKQNPYQNVNDYITYGIKANVLIYLSQLFVPTTYFSKGFTTTDGTTLQDNNGQTLLEYFALLINTFVKLDPAANATGKYQFAILSDDGATVEIQNTATGNWSTLINNDLQHATQLGCDLTGVDMKLGANLPMRIKYNQGPRYHIALTLLWRPFPTDPTKVKDVDCGQSGNDLYFGNVQNLPQADLKSYEYGKLVVRGWSPLQPSNFVTTQKLAP